MSENQFTDEDKIKAIEPSTKSWTKRVLAILPEIEAKLKEPGVTQQMVAEALGITQNNFSVYLSRARKLHEKNKLQNKTKKNRG